MSESSLLEQESFWTILKYLTELDSQTRVKQVCEDLSLELSEVTSYLHFLSELEYEFQLETKSDGTKWLNPPTERPRVNFEFSLLDWLQFQAHFPKLGECKGKAFHEEFKDKLISLENLYQNHDLFFPLKTLESVKEHHDSNFQGEVNSPLKEVLVFLEESIIEQIPVNIVFQNKTYRLYPRKILFFDGSLNLIAEDLSDKSLVNINLSEIQTAYEENEHYLPHYSKLEIDHFVKSLRSIHGNHIRLVLKIYGKDKFSLNFDQKYYDNICLFTNPYGDLIWAATLEPSEKIFEWLSELGPAVEILDPLNFKHQFLRYCEHKLKKIA